jgi:hypothetical protein
VFPWQVGAGGVLQATSQRPQFSWSEVRSRQLPEQSVFPSSHQAHTSASSFPGGTQISPATHRQPDSSRQAPSRQRTWLPGIWKVQETSPNAIITKIVRFGWSIGPTS